MAADGKTGEVASALTGLRVTMLLCGLLLAASSFLVGHWKLIEGQPANMSAAQNILASVGASFLFALILDVFSQLRRVLSNREFRRFFGSSIMRGDISLIYPDFVLNPEILRPETEIEKLSNYNKRTPHFDYRHFVVIPHVLAEVDVQAAVFISGMLGEYVSKPPALIPDSAAVPSVRTSFISFGLYSNDMTWLYLHTDPNPMFSIGEDPNGKRHLIFLGGGAENKIYGWDKNSDHAVIVKYRPQPRSDPDRIWIICAGLGVSGTTAAAWRFVNDWKEYWKEIGTKDFIIVLKVSNSLAAYESAVEVNRYIRPELKLI